MRLRDWLEQQAAAKAARAQKQAEDGADNAADAKEKRLLISVFEPSRFLRMLPDLPEERLRRRVHPVSAAEAALVARMDHSSRQRYGELYDDLRAQLVVDACNAIVACENAACAVIACCGQSFLAPAHGAAHVCMLRTSPALVPLPARWLFSQVQH